LTESVLIIGPFAGFLLSELAVPTLFLLLDLILLGSQLFLLSLAKELDVLLLESLVHATLAHLTGLTIFLLLKLFVQLCADQSAALLLTEHCLLLLLVVEQGVELLDGGPFVLLCQLRVDFCTAVSLTRSDAVLIEATVRTRTRANALRL